MNSHYLRPHAVLAPTIPHPHSGAAVQRREESFLQSLINSLSKQADVECPECHGSGVLSLKGICEQCMGRGHIPSR